MSESSEKEPPLGDEEPLCPHGIPKRFECRFCIADAELEDFEQRS